MKVRDICKKVRSGKILLEFAGHRVHTNKERFLADYDRNVANEKGANDGKWNSCDRDVKEVDAGMREHFRRVLDMEVPQNKDFTLRLDGEECSGCGQTLKWVLTGDKLQLRLYFQYDKKKKWGGDFILHPADYRCPFENPQPFRGSIKVGSRLLFANFFKAVEDEPKEKKWQGDWSLNHLAGRKKITDYKAAHNVAYGQMGNMSVGIYVHPNKKSIIVGDPHVFDRRCEDMSDEEYKKAKKNPALRLIDGHKMAGSIILDVWRWEATDLNTIGKKEYPKVAEENRSRRMVELDVPHGVWNFEHYYDTNTSPDQAIYAKLTFKGKQ